MSEGKSRQSSAGKSFFSRKKDKGSDGRSFDDSLGLEPPPGGATSAAGSKSSRHSHRPNSMSLDMDQGLDASGLSMTAGVITAIPYESLSQDNKTPIPVDYLPKNDQVATRKEPLPHHLSKGGVDFHQYPAWEPQKPHQAYAGVRDAQLANGSSNAGAPRPPPHSSHSSASSRERPLPPRPNMGGVASGQSGSAYQSQSESPSRGRNSFDQASVYSSISSTTRGSSIFSSDNSSRTAIPQHPHDSSFRPTSSQSSIRQSTSGWGAHQSPSFNAAASFAPNGFHLQRPADDSAVEAQFLAMMQKRDWQNLPEQARRQMVAYPAAKKWTLVQQDKLAEWQSEQKRRQNARQTLGAHDGAPGLLARADEEGSPEWYVKKVMEDSLTPKQLQSLGVSLRTQEIR
jgi:cytokinesis protein